MTKMKIEITNQGKWHESLTFKLGVLAFMGILLLIPLEMIKFIITERQSNAEKVRQEISKQWAARQYVSGPVLNIPVRTVPGEKEEKPSAYIWHILPETLEIDGNIKPEIRYRSIYQSVVYDSDLRFWGDFMIPDNNTLKNHEILWNEAYYTLGITDNRGLKGKVTMRVGSSELEADPGVRDQEIFPSGVSFPEYQGSVSGRIPFELSINLAGSEGIMLTPVGKTTKVHLQSGWTVPSFGGSFLPTKRTIDESGFNAEWEVTHLNRNYPQDWLGSTFHPEESSFGVDLLIPVDHYQKSWRSARYGILFIALTFLVLIFLEITREESIHILHYLLVSLGLVLFFSLLNALSEQTGFNLAYLIASGATILMITFFTGALFKKKTTTLIVALILVLLYIFIFILLTLNDYAYLAGNIGLFILLATIMWISTRLKILKKDTGNTAVR